MDLKLSVVIPAFNEQENIVPLLKRLRAVLDSMKDTVAEVIFVDDHSSDRTSEVVAAENRGDPRVKLLRLSRNSGSHMALQAGLARATGDVAVTISADLQDPPEMIPEMLARIRVGKNIVWAVRETRKDSAWNQFRAQLYHRSFRRFILRNYPAKGADHFMIDRKVLDSLRHNPEKNTSLMALVCWMGFEQDEVPFHRDERHHGETKWTFWKTFKLIIDSLLSFSYLPIRFISFLGLIISLTGFIYIAVLIFRYVFLGVHGQPGWASLMVMVVFLAGIQMLMLGVLGEYLWRIFEEVRRRPAYMLEKEVGFDSR